jgi:hypothetical protein
MDHAAHGGGLDPAHRRRDLVERQAQCPRAGRRREAVLDVVEPVEGQADFHGLAAGLQTETAAHGSGRLGPEIAGSDVRVLRIQSVPDHPGAMALRDPRDLGIVRVGHDEAVRREARQDLGFGLGDGLHALEELQVDGADDREDGRVRPAQERELAQLAGSGHAHLGHHPLGAVRHVEEREREAVEIVQVARRPVGPEPGIQHGRQQLLGGGLAGRARDAHELFRHAGTHETGEVVEGLEGVVHADQGARGCF